MPILFALLAVLASSGVQPGPGPHARVTLVAERSSLEPGTENMLGVHFVLEPGWHIYWRNPGDSGAPPLVQWKLPPGYVAEDLLYPAPQRIASGSLANYGYERDVLLLAPIRVPSDAGAGADISASVRFIVCREVCIPGRAAPSLALPVGGPAHASGSRALFDAARARVPQRAPAAWTSTAVISADDILVTLTTGRRESGWQFFPLETGIVNDSAAPQYEPIADGLRIHLKRSDQLTRVPERLSFVVEGADGRAFVVSARVAR